MRAPRPAVVAAGCGVALVTAVVAALVITPSRDGSGSAAEDGTRSGASGPTRLVSYHGYQARVPSSWPVYDLTKDPTRCVRFDQHAVYLGTPGPDQRCPAHAVGRTEALWIRQSGPGGDGGVDGALHTDVPEAGVSVTATYLTDRRTAAQIVQSGTTADPAATATTSSTPTTSPAPGDSGTATSAGTATGTSTASPTGPAPTGDTTTDTASPTDTAPSGTATPSDSPATDGTATTTDTATPADTTPSDQTTAATDPSANASSTADPAATADPTGTATTTPTPTGTPTTASPTPTPVDNVSVVAPSGVPTLSGPERHWLYSSRNPGFDACTAPSTATMSAWSSAYHAIGIYVGGINRACGDGNLSSAWVKTVQGMGYSFLPVYVGLQAPCNTRTTVDKIDPAQADAQGVAAADDAVAKMVKFGFGTGNVVYLDMEPYTVGGSCSTAVLKFVSGWTRRLHQLGYNSGVYCNAANGSQDLAAASGSTTYTVPDALWFARWNGRQDVDDTPYVPNTLWVHRRIHQYKGDVTEIHNGVTLNIDTNWLDGLVSLPGTY